METTVAGRMYVTARGWEDLSEIIYMYEEDGLSVDESLIGQYIRSDNIVREFAAYYDLYNKYKNDYKVDDILSGNITEVATKKAGQAGFDERLSLLGMLLDKVQTEIKEVILTSDYLSELMAPLKACRQASDGEDMLSRLSMQAEAREKLIENKERANTLSKPEKLMHKRVKRFIEEAYKEIISKGIPSDAKVSEGGEKNDEIFAYIKQKFDAEVEAMRHEVAVTGEKLHNLFEFTSKAFDDGNEMLILVTELTVSRYSSRFISMFGSEDYHKYNQLLMITERQQDMRENIRKLDLGDVGTDITRI